MHGTPTRLRLFLASALALLVSVSIGLAAGNTVKWKIRVQPASGGDVEWSTSSPHREGVVTSSKVVSFDRGADLDVWFVAKPGYELISVQKGDQEMVFFLDIFDHFTFGPVDGSHDLTATFKPVVPTGVFDLVAPTGDRDVPRMVDLTGSYMGVSPTKYARHYAFDAAMDESGKVSAMGNVEGIEPKGGGEIAGGIGKVKSVAGTPTLDAKGKFAGTRDGVPASGAASVAGPAELQGSKRDTAEGSLTYKAKAGGVPFRDKNVPIQAVLSPAMASNVRTAWSIRLNVVERAVQKAGKTQLTAAATLRLPNGDTLEFPEKKVKYSAKKGLKLKLRKGLNVTRVPNVVDKKTKVNITGMTLEKFGSTWHVTGGRIQYRFLGQKGAADLAAFVRN